MTVDKVSKLIANLRKDWDRLEQEDLADQIIAIEREVSSLKNGRNITHLKKKSEHLQFDFVFPICLELEKKGYSFAKEIDRIAKQMIKDGSLDPFYQLNEIQQQEILRRCA